MSWEAPLPNPLPDDDSRFYQIAIVSSLGFALALILVSARLFTRIRLLRVADWSDIVLGFALVLNCVATSLELSAGRYGAGRHVYYLSDSDLATASLLGTIGVPFSQLALSLPKIAAVGVLVRIAGPQAPKWIRIYLFTITAVMTILSILYSVFLFVQCSPTFALWTQVSGARCWDPRVIASTGITTSIFSAFVDLNLAIYPIIILRRLQMDPRKKVGICILMGLGLAATVCAGFKIPHLKDQTQRDITWEITALTCWTSAEVNLVMIAASLPLLRPLWLWLTGKPYTNGASASRGGSAANLQGANRRGFVSFGSKKDAQNEMTADIDLEETAGSQTRDNDVLASSPKSSDRMLTHGGIMVEKSITVSTEEV